jgi:hypothetical protein
MAFRSQLLILPLSALAILALAGCAPTATSSTDAPTNTPSATATLPPTPSPTASAAASDIDGIPMTIGCRDLISDQAIYDYNPNFSLKADYAPAAGGLAASVARQNGLACGWVNQTSGELIELAVANLPAAHSTRLKNDLVSSSKSVPTYGVEGYFRVNGGSGEAQAFADPYWIVAVSTGFFEPGDAAPIIADAVKSLGR